MRRADDAAIRAGTPGLTLMHRAGSAVAGRALALCGEGRILVLCGPGNNGGDGFVAARVLAEAGRDVAVALLGDRAALTGDAAAAAAEWPGPVADAAEAEPRGFTLVVDALFGPACRGRSTARRPPWSNGSTRRACRSWRSTYPRASTAIPAWRAAAW